jgi:hypothetical protein
MSNRAENRGLILVDSEMRWANLLIATTIWASGLLVISSSQAQTKPDATTAQDEIIVTGVFVNSSLGEIRNVVLARYTRQLTGWRRRLFLCPCKKMVFWSSS